jgi:hypothetical protein
VARSFRLHHVMCRSRRWNICISASRMPRREQTNGSRDRCSDGASPSATEGNLCNPLTASLSYHHPSRYSLPFTHPRQMDFTRRRQANWWPRPSSSCAITTLLSQRRGWSDRGGNARTDSCMSRGRTAVQVGDVQCCTVLSCRAFHPSAPAEGQRGREEARAVKSSTVYRPACSSDLTRDAEPFLAPCCLMRAAPVSMHEMLPACKQTNDLQDTGLGSNSPRRCPYSFPFQSQVQP